MAQARDVHLVGSVPLDDALFSALDRHAQRAAGLRGVPGEEAKTSLTALAVEPLLSEVMHAWLLACCMAV
jgi:hypothetical protein